MRNESRHPHHGFTLVELAIVLFIVTLLLGGMLTPLSQQIAGRQTSDTRRTLDEARIALIGHAITHARLPCPDHDGDGSEDRTADATCKATVGRLPWLTLGSAEADAWGNRLDYAVSPDFAAAITPAATATVELCPHPACAQPQLLAAIVLSHGRNGLGADNTMGRQNLAPAAAGEQANVDGDLRFILHPPSAADRADGEFDDLAITLSPAWLLGRVCDPVSACATDRVRASDEAPTLPPMK